MTQAKSGPIGLVMELEGCDSLASAAAIKPLLKQGIKIVSLTWNLKNKFAGGLWCRQGLTHEGAKLVRIVADAGGAMDLVHLNDVGVKKVLKLLPERILVSHTALSTYSRHTQNLTPQTIEQIIARGGLVGFAFLRTFYSKLKSGWQRVATLEKVAMEMETFKRRFGTANIAIGSDYAGYPYHAGVVGAENILGLLQLRKLLQKKGWTALEIESLFFKNAQRFLSELF